MVAGVLRCQCGRDGGMLRLIHRAPPIVYLVVGCCRRVGKACRWIGRMLQLWPWYGILGDAAGRQCDLDAHRFAYHDKMDRSKK